MLGGEAEPEGAIREVDPGRAATALKMIDLVPAEGEGAGRDRAGGAGEAAMAWAGKLIQEIRRSHDYARRETRCPAIEAIALSGEGALVRNIQSYFERQMKVETIIVNPVGSGASAKYGGNVISKRSRSMAAMIALVSGRTGIILALFASGKVAKDSW